MKAGPRETGAGGIQHLPTALVLGAGWSGGSLFEKGDERSQDRP